MLFVGASVPFCLKKNHGPFFIQRGYIIHQLNLFPSKKKKEGNVEQIYGLLKEETEAVSGSFPYVQKRSDFINRNL